METCFNVGLLFKVKVNLRRALKVTRAGEDMVGGHYSECSPPFKIPNKTRTWGCQVWGADGRGKPWRRWEGGRRRMSFTTRAESNAVDGGGVQQQALFSTDRNSQQYFSSNNQVAIAHIVFPQIAEIQAPCGPERACGPPVCCQSR